MSRRPTWLAAALLVAVFATGTLVGAGASAWAARGEEPRRAGREGRYLDRLTGELSLTPAQRESVQAVLDRHRPEIDSLWEEIAPRYQAVRRTIRTEIRTHLEGDQLARYEAMLARMDAERERERNSGKK